MFVKIATLASVVALVSSANALLSLPYKKCDNPRGCVTKKTSIIMEGAGTDYENAQVFPFQRDGIKLTAPISRSYVVAPNASSYEMFYLKNRQLSIDINSSKVQCGYNAAFYFSSMNQSSTIGHGYCDAQGTWCNEMDIFEGNYGAFQIASHSCSYETGVCDPWGCAVNTYYSGAQVGPGLLIDTNYKYKLTTKFYTSDNTDAGELNRIVQVYSQGNRSVQVAELTQDFCQNGFYWNVSGRFPALSRALELGQVMIFSFWGWGGDTMSWLDGGAANNPRCANVDPNINEVTFQNVVVDYIDGKRPKDRPHSLE